MHITVKVVAADSAFTALLVAIAVTQIMSVHIVISAMSLPPAVPVHVAFLDEGSGGRGFEPHRGQRFLLFRRVGPFPF